MLWAGVINTHYNNVNHVVDSLGAFACNNHSDWAGTNQVELLGELSI